MPYTSYSEREREMMRRARPAHHLVKNGVLEGWKALWLITAPDANLRERWDELQEQQDKKTAVRKADRSRQTQKAKHGGMWH